MGRYPKPKYDTIIEPFAGSAGYSHRYYERQVILVEIDPTIASVWNYLIKATSDDIMSLPIVPPGVSTRDLGLPEPERCLIGFWVARGRFIPGATLSSWARASWPDPPVYCWGPRCRERLANNVEKINHWQIIQGSYELAPFVEATWHIDPPYTKAGKCYKFGSNKIDYRRLAEWCRSRPGQVHVCENKGADWLPFKYLYETLGSAKDGNKRKRSEEVIWTNDPGPDIK